MKRILSIVLLLPLVAPARAQSSSDTVAQKREVFVEDRYRDPDRRAGGENQSKFVLRINDFSKKRAGERHNKLFWNDGHWAGIGIHYSGLITNLGKLKLPDHLQCLSQSAKSIGVTLNPVDLTLLKSRRFGLITGLGFEFNNFRFENNIALKYEHGVTVPDFQYEEQRIRLQKSKLFTCYLNVPLLVEFQMGRHNLFYVNAVSSADGAWAPIRKSRRRIRTSTASSRSMAAGAAQFSLRLYDQHRLRPFRPLGDLLPAYDIQGKARSAGPADKYRPDADALAEDGRMRGRCGAGAERHPLRVVLCDYFAARRGSDL